jgi:hypothetical protein
MEEWEQYCAAHLAEALNDKQNLEEVYIQLSLAKWEVWIITWALAMLASRYPNPSTVGKLAIGVARHMDEIEKYQLENPESE